MTNNNKKRILFCTESTHIRSGYGNYTRSILDRLYATQKYEIAELSCYRTVKQDKDCPWKIYPNAVEKDDQRFEKYSSNASNGFGQWRFDMVVGHFKPDIVIDFRDIFMTSFERTSIFRDKFHWILAPTIDSFPIKHEWLDLLKNCDTLLTHTHWAKETIEKLYGISVSGVVKDSIDAKNFKPKNKILCRNELDLDLDAFIIGSVMRNQKRKLIPELFKIISALKYRFNQNIYLYMHTSYPESMGWDIPDLLLEHKIYDNVIFTYVCKKCNYWKPMKWKGAQSICPKCSHRQMTLANVTNGISDNDLCKIYNALDIYVQYSICEGFGIPPLEAASCGIPFITVDHGAMAELADDLYGTKVPVAGLFRDQEIGSDRIYPSNKDCIESILKIKEISLSDKALLSSKQLEKVSKEHSWDLTAKVFEKIIDEIKIKDKNNWDCIPSTYFSSMEKNIKETTNNREFVYNIVDNILETPELKSSFFVQQLIMAIDNGYIVSDKNIVQYTQKDALKTLEVWFNNKIMLNRFLEDNTIITQNDFLNY